MFRGVNKNIIEITQTDSQYFDKVILFVRQNHREKDSEELEQFAKEYIKDMAEEISAPSSSAAVGTKERVGLKSILVKVAVAIALVAAAAMFVFI